MTDQHAFFHQLHQLTRYLSKALNDKLAVHGIYSSQWTILYRLKQIDRCTQAELAHYLGVEAPTITRTLARLESFGWIERSPGKDKREKVVSLTDKALQAFPEWVQSVREFEAEMLKDVSEDQQKSTLETVHIIMNRLNN
ncbi:MarR family winged helix-turn-helix transcriptional regulator [Falsibacillus pallidus]|uniref:MarR family transcriptional regulator n=1 Tax=Falsibacillus pallidus TaxID=493781 RepID=A0A370GIN9_9BACI|nr:MarR family transcriptional regulator [Falsibacillus pallidus]RDI42244.1 MarR family transcriptional regulator [Falsibacillus pallidus]